MKKTQINRRAVLQAGATATALSTVPTAFAQ